MKRALFILLAVSAASAQAQVYRCTAAGGAVTYQEMPCPDGAPGKTMDTIPSAYPSPNSVERERLLAREAAHDARMIEKERIESAERIARMDIAAREREAQAAREAAAAAAASQAYTIPVWGYYGGYRPPHVVHYRYQNRPVTPLR